MTQVGPNDITNVMLMEAIHDIKSDVRDLKTDVKDLKTDVKDLKFDFQELRQEMGDMEVRLEIKIVEESDRIARAIVPSNRQLAAEISKLKKFVDFTTA